MSNPLKVYVVTYQLDDDTEIIGIGARIEDANVIRDDHSKSYWEWSPCGDVKIEEHEVRNSLERHCDLKPPKIIWCSEDYDGPAWRDVSKPRPAEEVEAELQEIATERARLLAQFPCCKCGTVAEENVHSLKDNAIYCVKCVVPQA